MENEAVERPGVTLPLVREFAIVSTLALTAAPVVLVGGVMLMALVRKLRGTDAEGAETLTEATGSSRSAPASAVRGTTRRMPPAIWTSASSVP